VPDLAALPAEERAEALDRLVLGQVADVLGHADPGSLDPSQGFMDLGMDSLTAVELRNRLGAALGHRLPSTLLFDHPTVSAVVAYLDAEVLPGAPVAGMAELDALDALLRRLPPGDDHRALVTERLQAILAATATAGTATAGNGAVQLLESATDEDLFDFLDNELGVGETDA
jgi:acyl carrier protein